MSKLSIWRVPVIVVLAVWAWQIIVYRLLVPRSGLAYGWFKTPAGHAADIWILVVPVWAGVLTMVSDATVGTVQIWKEGRRRRIVGLWLWCLLLTILCLTPSLFLDFQGNASIFI